MPSCRTRTADMEMELLAASLMPYPHSAPLYLLYDAASTANNANHGLLSAPPPLLGDGEDDSFEFATTTSHPAALRACASDVSAGALADKLFRAGALLPLSLPPRLQRPGSAGPASAATSPTSATFSRSSRKHRGFDPFAAALEKVRRDDGAGAPAPAVRRARSLSPLRGAAAVTAQTNSGGGGDSRAAARRPARKGKGKGRGVRDMLCRVLMASAAAAPKALWPRRKDGGVSYRPGLLVCLGYGV